MADMNMDAAVSASDWSKGISLSILASIIGGASKLAIRKSWLMEEEQRRNLQDSLLPVTDQDEEDEEDGVISEQDPLHQRHSHHSLAQQEEDQDNPQSDTTIVRLEQPLQVDVEDSLPNSHDEEATPSLRSRRTTASRSTSGNISVASDSDNDDEDNVSCWRGSKLVARCLRGSGMIGMTLLNPLACVLAMNYASPSILAPFSGLTLVWIVLLSNPVIGEQPTAPQIMAACLIIFGEVIVAIFGDHTNDEGVTVEDVVRTILYSLFLIEC
jgi:hypothetical protein